MSHEKCGAHTLLGSVWTKLNNTTHKVQKLSAVHNTWRQPGLRGGFVDYKVVSKSQFNRPVGQAVLPSYRGGHRHLKMDTKAQTSFDQPKTLRKA